MPDTPSHHDLRLRLIASIPPALFEAATKAGIRSPDDLTRLAFNPRATTISAILAQRERNRPDLVAAREAFLAGQADRYLGMSRSFWETDASVELREFCLSR
jgi:hypothetical protein